MGCEIRKPQKAREKCKYVLNCKNVLGKGKSCVFYF